MDICKFLKVFKLINKNYTRSVEDIREIDYEELKELLRKKEKIEIIDIRSPQEFEERRIKFAINIPLYDLKKKSERMLPDKDSLIVLYCGCGIRSKKAYKILQQNGYKNLYSLKGGIEEI